LCTAIIIILYYYHYTIVIWDCDQLILKGIVGKAAEGFAVLADETTDIATKEQLTLCVCFTDNNNVINESFYNL
jgi:hypothetical protein